MLGWIGVLIGFCLAIAEAQDKRPNFLLILADDLGFGDTSVHPFVGSGVKTPNLERMAKNGAVLVNYHTAAATCSPTRASILTGLYPWRVGLKAVYEYGLKGKSNRDDWLPRLPTMPAVFAENNYTTFHSGKWHVGGMRNDDYDMRLLPDKGGENAVGSRRCPHPGPIQQGFQHYVSVLDGPGAPRQNRLQVDSTLYRLGCNHLLRDDEPIQPQSTGISGYLSFCEAMHAIRVMEDSAKRGIPFYVQVWFHAPHGPWEEIPEFRDWYPDQLRPSKPDDVPPCNGNFNPNKQRWCRNGNNLHDRGVTRFAQYRTMVSDMDKQIGMLLDSLRRIGIENNTLVVFSSDNGPEDAAGGAGILRGNKRHIYEGGIRVPAVAQWSGVIPAGTEVGSMIVSTDWMPTFLEAAGATLPPHVMIDGHSVLSELIHPTAPARSASLSAAGELESSAAIEHKRNVHPQRISRHRRKSRLHDRLVLWHNDYEGPRRTAAWVHDFKIFLNELELPLHLFDMKVDIKESHDLLPVKTAAEWKRFLASCSSPALSRSQLKTQRTNTTLHLALICKIYPHMIDYVKHGDQGWRTYLQRYPKLRYNPTPFSDQRPVLGIRVTHDANERLRRELLHNTGCGEAPCGCSFLGASHVPTLEFPVVAAEQRSCRTIAPFPFVNSSQLLGL